MLSLAVSIGILVAGSHPGQLNAREQAAWARLRPSIAIIRVGGSPVGPAALIDSSGLFVAHRSAMVGSAISADLPDGSTVTMKVLGRDGPTQLVLLQAIPWSGDGMRPVHTETEKLAPGSMVLAVLPNGPIRAELISANRFGVVQPYRRALPLCELRLEGATPAMGGALVFSEEGDLVGSMSATLGRQGEDFGAPSGGAQPVQSLSSDLTVKKLLLPKSPRILGLPYGPDRLTVAYAVGPEAIKRVIEGFRSPSHEVLHPSLGVFCQDSSNGGALVISVSNGSPADAAGIRPGDIIQEIDGLAVSSQVDFARAMFGQRVGSSIPVRIKRGPTTTVLDVKVAGQTIQ